MLHRVRASFWVKIDVCVFFGRWSVAAAWQRPPFADDIAWSGSSWLVATAADAQWAIGRTQILSAHSLRVCVCDLSCRKSRGPGHASHNSWERMHNTNKTVADHCARLHRCAPLSLKVKNVRRAHAHARVCDRPGISIIIDWICADRNEMRCILMACWPGNCVTHETEPNPANCYWLSAAHVFCPCPSSVVGTPPECSSVRRDIVSWFDWPMYCISIEKKAITLYCTSQSSVSHSCGVKLTAR